MPSPNRISIPPPRARHWRLKVWTALAGWVLWITLETYLVREGFFTRKDELNIVWHLILFCWITATVFSHGWLTLFPTVLTVSPEELRIQRGRFPLQRWWLVPWSNAVFLRSDEGLVVCGVKSWFSKRLILEGHLDDVSRDRLIQHLHAILRAHGVAFQSDDARVKLMDARHVATPAGGTDASKHWKG